MCQPSKLATAHQRLVPIKALCKQIQSTPDDRCRPTHVAAGGQVVPIDELFRVGGFKMEHPGDMSNGAPIKEAAGCRCTVLPVV